MERQDEPLFYEKAQQFLVAHKPDSAFLMFDQAKDFYLQNESHVHVAACLIEMALIQRDQGDYFGAQETSLEALTYLNDDDLDHRVYYSSAYNTLAMASGSLKDVKNAIKYYELAFYYSDPDRSANTYVLRNNLAIAYSRADQYERSLGILQDILAETGDVNPKEFARVLSNYADVKAQRDTSYNAAPELLKALRIRKDIGDLRGQNASYAHLADYYEQRQPDLSLFYANAQYDNAKRIHSGDAQVNALDRLIKLSPARLSKEYYKEYKRLRDSVYTVRAGAKNQFALIRYEVEKNKAANLRLENENMEKAARLDRQRLLTGAVSALMLLSIVAGVTFYKKRKQKMALEAAGKIKEYQIQTSRKVHDVVANGLYRVMSEIENTEEIDRERILDHLEEMYDKSRDISYETKTTAINTDEEAFPEAVSRLIKSFASRDCRVLIVGNEVDLWENVPSVIQVEVKHVLQELMVNMKKHSGAQQVVVRFDIDDNTLRLHYSDDGKGMAKGTKFGNGLTNTGNRIQQIKGNLTFVSGQENGLAIVISIPLSALA